MLSYNRVYQTKYNLNKQCCLTRTNERNGNVMQNFPPCTAPSYHTDDINSFFVSRELHVYYSHNNSKQSVYPCHYYE